MSTDASLPLIYVAGPYTHPDPVANTHLALEAAERIMASGLGVPHVPHLTLAWHLVYPHEEGFWYGYDLHLLRRCDALLRLSGASKGADAEVVGAERLGIPVFFSETRLWEWLRGKGATSGRPAGCPAVSTEAAAPILAVGSWRTNADLIADCARLGYLRDEWSTLDPTYGLGTFWRKWRPNRLIGTDLDPSKSCTFRISVDFTAIPWTDHSFDAVVFDPPYKLNGKPEAAGLRYGTRDPATPAERLDLIARGVAECARVLDRGCLLVKCQDQVVSGRVVWQTDLVTSVAETSGLAKVDRFDFLSYRPQPPGRRQLHARRNASQLLVFARKGWRPAGQQVPPASRLSTTPAPSPSAAVPTANLPRSHDEPQP